MDTGKFIDELSLRVQSGFNEKSGDYMGEDGMLYCGICHTRKTCRVSIFGRDRVVNCTCKHEAEARESRETARRRGIEIERNLKAGFPHADYEKMTFAFDDRKNPKATEYARNYADNFNPDSGMGLLFCGERGAGKTFLSACIANALIYRGYSVLMTNVTKISQVVDATFEGKSAELNRILSVGLLILDDLGTERGTEYMLEHAFNVVDGRYKANKPMIVSTNVTLREMMDETDLGRGRIYDRVLERCFPVEMSGNRRRDMASANMMQGVLG